MTTLYMIGGAVLLLALLIWIYGRSKASGAKAEIRQEIAEADAKAQAAAGKVIAEHRTKDDAANRLDSGSF